MVKAVIFDLYGVLGLNGWQDFKRDHFADRREVWEHLRSLGQRVDAGKATEAEFVQAVAEASGETGATVRYQFEHTKPNTELLDYIGEELKGKFKLGLLTNASHDVLEGILSPEQRTLFDASITSFHVGMTKPDPRMFQLMADELEVRPEECVLVDDQERHLEAATKLGMIPVLYESVGQTVEAIRKATQ